MLIPHHEKHLPLGELGTAFPRDIGQLQKTSQLQLSKKFPFISQCKFNGFTVIELNKY